MDCPYWMPTASKRYGVLEVLAASTFENFGNNAIPECVFTQILTKALQDRATQTWRGPTYVTDLHAHLAALYLNLIPDRRRNKQKLKSFPAPFHMLVAGRHTTRSSIQLAPRSQPQPSSQSEERREEPKVIALQFYGGDEDRESLNEWLRLRPENVRVKIEEYNGGANKGHGFSGLLPRPETVPVKTDRQEYGPSSKPPTPR